MTSSPSPMVSDPQVPARRSRCLRASITVIVVVALIGVIWLVGVKRLHALVWDMGWHEGGRFANPAISAYRLPTRVRAYAGPAQQPSWTGVPWLTCAPVIYYQNEAQILPPLRSGTGANLRGLSRQPHGSGTATRKNGHTPTAPTMHTAYVSGNQLDILPLIFIGGGQRAVTLQSQSVSPPQTIYENVGLTVGGRTSGNKANFWSGMLHTPLLHRVAMRLGPTTVTWSTTTPDAKFGVEYAQSIRPIYQWSVIQRHNGLPAQYCKRRGPPTLNFCVGTGYDLMVLNGVPPGTKIRADSRDHAAPSLRLHMSIRPGSPRLLLAQACALIRKGAARGELAMFLAGPYGGVRGGTDFQEAAALLRAAARGTKRGIHGGVPVHMAARIQADRCWFRVLRVGDYTGALRTLRRQSAEAPDDPQILLMIATLEASREYVWQSEKIRKHGPDYAAELQVIAKTTRVAPSYAAAWWVEGQLNALAGNRSAVISDDRRFLALASHIDMFPYLYDYRLMAQRVAATRKWLGVVDRGGSAQKHESMTPVDSEAGHTNGGP